MVRKVVNIGYHRYLTEFYKHNEFDINESYDNYYVMIRNFDIVNDIIHYTHIYIIEWSLWYTMCRDIEANKDKYTDGLDITRFIAFPIYNTKLSNYSGCYSDFNSNFTRDSLYRIVDGQITYGHDVCPILDHKGNLKKIKCNKLKIYHPLTKKNLNAIVTIDNYINNIHWYYLCSPIFYAHNSSETEIRINNDIYSEYVELFFPDIDELFKLNEIKNGKEIYNAYFNETLNTIISVKNENFINRLTMDNIERYYSLGFNVDFDINIDEYKLDEEKYYYYYGEIPPIVIENGKYVINKVLLDPLNNSYKDMEFDNIYELALKIKNHDSTSILDKANPDENYQFDGYEKYILLPVKLSDYVQPINIFNVNDEDRENQIITFESLCDVIFDDIVINSQNYKLYKVKSKVKNIVKNSVRYNLDTPKYFYVGERCPLTFIDNKNKNKQHIFVKELHENKYVTQLFYDFDDVFQFNKDAVDKIIRYNNYYFNSKNKPIYILFPSIFYLAENGERNADQFLFFCDCSVDENMNNNNITFMEFSNIELLLHNVKIKGEPENMTYTLIRINNPNTNRIKICYIQDKTNREGLIDYDNIDDDEYSLRNYLELQNQLIPLNLLTQPYRIIDDIDPLTGDKQNAKLYIKQQVSIENNYLTIPFNLIIYPYSYLDETTHNYMFDEWLSIATNVYTTESRFEIIARISFDENTHKMSIITDFIYPYKKEYLSKYNNDSHQALSAAYKFFNNINLDDYKYFWVNIFLNKCPELEESFIHLFDEKFNDPTDIDYNRIHKTIIDNTGEEIDEILSDVTDKEKLRRVLQTYEAQSILDEKNIQLRDWEIEEEYETTMDFVGYRIQVSSDALFNHIIYNKTFTTDIDSIDNFSFDITGMFSNWNELPDRLMARTMFIDHILNKVLYSNIITISKEQYKFMIQNNRTFFINKLNKYNDMLKEINLDNYKNTSNLLNDYMDSITALIKNTDIDQEEKENKLNKINQVYKKQIEDNYNTFNFINSVNCVVNRNDEVLNYSGNISNSFNHTKVIYQPVFYRTQDLQNLKLRLNISQNIGINLVQYMTKVETFKLLIDGNEYIEKGRNDIYVIFKINTGSFENSSGVYTIIDQDDEYISSGQWSLY